MIKTILVVASAPFLAAMGLVGAGGSFAALEPGLAHPPSAAGPGLPRTMLALYQAAAGVCPGLSWAVLAAVGTIESANGTSSLPGVRSGANPAGAEGPMQFEPRTFARYALPVPPGGARPPSPYDPADSIYAAARYLCALGAASDPRNAAVAYNCGNAGPRCRAVSAMYGDEVLRVAAGLLAGPAAAAATALAYAQSQLGVPYLWGGEVPGQAFDCSGLVQWAYAQAGVTLPRTAQAQFDAGPGLPPAAPLLPGDLIFFGSSSAAVYHVGIYAGDATMIDAPHAGADVRIEPFVDAIGANWGKERLIGVTRPAGEA